MKGCLAVRSAPLESTARRPDQPTAAAAQSRNSVPALKRPGESDDEGLSVRECPLESTDDRSPSIAQRVDPRSQDMHACDQLPR